MPPSVPTPAERATLALAFDGPLPLTAARDVRAGTYTGHSERPWLETLSAQQRDLLARRARTQLAAERRNLLFLRRRRKYRGRPALLAHIRAARAELRAVEAASRKDCP